MKRFVPILLALALIVLLLGMSASRVTESVTLVAISVALVLIERVLAAVRSRMSQGIDVVGCTRAVCRLHRTPRAPARQTGVRRASECVTLTLSRTGRHMLIPNDATQHAVPRYRALSHLRRTALHEVLLAHDDYTNRRVIIKRTLPGAPNHDLRREAGMLFWLDWARLPIPAPQYVAYEERDGRSTLTMTYINGRTIEEVTDDGHLAVTTLVYLLAKTCIALDALHRAGYVHQDIKPTNLILDHSGTLVVIDWGSARRHDLPYDPRSITCTPEFASPEQLRGMVLPGNDLYAIGKTLEAVIPAPPPALARVIARATGPSPYRYATGAELAQALLAAVRSDAM